MDYLDLVSDFANRTKHNLETLESLNQESYTVYEVTQLINSCIGLLIIPQQEYWDQIPRKPIEELIEKGWKVPEVVDGFPQVNDLRELMRYLRNAIAHFNIEFETNQRDQLSRLVLWNTNPGTKKRTWMVCLGIKELKELLYKFLEVLKEINDKQMLRILTYSHGPDKILNITPFPKPWNPGLKNIKAIYLGCDPSNNSGDQFEYVFALEGNKPRYTNFIKSHAENLAAVNLTWNSVYVQNLCRNYFHDETSKNLTLWKQVARHFWVPRLKQELSIFRHKMPVLLTSQYLLEVLAFDGYEKIPAYDFYNCDHPVPIPAERNLLGRPLIPFYRGYNQRIKESYHLYNERWQNYRKRIREIIPTISL